MSDRFADLAARGLNVVGVLTVDEALAAVPQLAPVDGFTHVIVVGSTGEAMWRSVQARGYLQRPHPIDEHAADALEAFESGLVSRGFRVRRAWPRPPGAPGREAAPLRVTKLGEAAGWGRRSLLGLGMHPRFGMWVGYRGVLLVDGEWAAVREPAAPHPCDDCPRPCAEACPASAIGGTGGIATAPCFSERLRADAPCNHRCLARLACPVAGGRYSDAQIAHHQEFGNRLYGRWAATESDA